MDIFMSLIKSYLIFDSIYFSWWYIW